MQGASWRLRPEKNLWESPALFALEGLEHLLDTTTRDVAELSAVENLLRRKRIAWLAKLALNEEFKSHAFEATPCPEYQLDARLKLVRWKAFRVTEGKEESLSQLHAERSKLVQHWRPFEWLHEAVSLLSHANRSNEDPLAPFVGPSADHTRRGAMTGFAGDVFRALLPQIAEKGEVTNASDESKIPPFAYGIAFQTIVSITPRRELLNCLNRRPQLIWGTASAASPNRLPLPPLPGITNQKLFSCLGEDTDARGLATIHSLEAIEFGHLSEASTLPSFFGANGDSQICHLIPIWRSSAIDGTNGTLQKLEADLDSNNYLSLRDKVSVLDKDLSSDTLKQAAALFRAFAQIVISYSQSNEDKELVPAWPYIAFDEANQVHYLLGEGVSRSELGSRAFVRDGGRTLRTIEVPIYEANLWRVGVAISDFLGLHDDVAKFNTAELDVTLDVAALANPARYVLRAQLRKLRGAYADSQIGRRRSDNSMLPATVERSLHLLESFPTDADNTVDLLLHVLASSFNLVDCRSKVR